MCIFSSIKLHFFISFLPSTKELSDFEVLWKILCTMKEFQPEASLITFSSGLFKFFLVLSHPYLPPGTLPLALEKQAKLANSIV